MNNRRNLLGLGIIIMIIILTGCPFSIKPVLVPEENYKANYDKMFKAAIDAGTTLGYHVEFKDKERGMIKLLKQIMDNNYRITVQFGKLRTYGGKLGFQVYGQAKDIVNPFIGKEVQEITDAINKAAKSGASSKETQPTSIPPSPPPTTPKLEPTSSETSDRIYLITIKNSNVRAAPNTKSQIIAVMKKGTKLEKISESREWFEVRLPSGETGYVYKPLVIAFP